MDDESLIQRVLHLSQVEKLSGRQIAKLLKIGPRRVSRILKGEGCLAQALAPKSMLDPYRHLIVHWYKQYPYLSAKQIYERLKPYGYQGSYGIVVWYTREYRQPKQEAYHPLVFLPGEEAQVDWFFLNHEKLGQVAGFVYVLAYSRYAWGMFYRKTTFEFFLAGHVACFKQIGGLAHQHRYDNLKSVVIRRSPEIQYNGQFLDFARYYGFSIHVCNPYSGNEKGRVERLIRDIRGFLYAENFIDLVDLNRKFHLWLENRNNTIHRSTGKTPKELLNKERLLGLPPHPYPTSRIITAVVSKTALVEFETNKYSVPSTCATKAVEIAAYPSYIEIYRSEQSVAIHERSFDKNKVIQNPLHAETLLNHTPQFKMQRILQLISNMSPVFDQFINGHDTDEERINAAYQLFTLLKTHSKVMLISAVRELNTLKCFKIRALNSLLHLPESIEPQLLWPQDANLLNLKYQERNLNDYDPNSKLWTQLKFVSDSSSLTEEQIKLLLPIFQEETSAREVRRIKHLIGRSGIKRIKRLEDFDWKFNPQLPRSEIIKISDTFGTKEVRNAILIGPSGVGKSHLASGICYKALQKGVPATFITCFDLVNKLKRSNRKHTLLNYYSTINVLCLDELGYVFPNQEQANDIFQIISKRSELASTIVTTNLIPSQWGKIFEASTATAILDRLSLNGSFITLEGRSYRSKK